MGPVEALNKGLVRAPLSHMRSHQVAYGRAQERPAKGCSTQRQGGCSLWRQPALTCIPHPGLGLPPGLPPAAWISVALSGQDY